MNSISVTNVLMNPCFSRPNKLLNISPLFKSYYSPATAERLRIRLMEASHAADRNGIMIVREMRIERICCLELDGSRHDKMPLGRQGSGIRRRSDRRDNCLSGFYDRIFTRGRIGADPEITGLFDKTKLIRQIKIHID